MYYFYILSNNRSELYKGISNNITRRLGEHNRNRNIGTRGKGPWKLVYYEECADRTAARLKEKYYKSGVGRERLKSILINIKTYQG